MPEVAPVDETAPLTDESFRHPTLECDIVMKGGITSGVIYPLAVCELAKTYRLRSLGGASAGAIAAAAAAAAEVGRATLTAAAPSGQIAATATAPTSATTPLPPGFLGLSEFPRLLAEQQDDHRSLLFHLFRPQPRTRRLFAVLTAALDQLAPASPAARTSVLVVARRVLTGVLSRARLRALVAVLPGLVLAAVGVVGLVVLGAAGVLSSLLLTLVGLALVLAGLVAAAVTAVLSDLRRLPAVGFGISSGRGETDQDVALTPWLYARLQELAGLPANRPLTFGDLRASGVELKVMTTNLSRAQPRSLPWDDETYFYDPEEFRGLFGQVVTKAMEVPAPPPGTTQESRDRAELLQAMLPKRPLPPPDLLPVIVATRMSLSFPLLISAVPLYTVDHTQAALTVQRNWFSDGGLTANLPVQFFDSPLPTRPTFAIDLAPFAADHPRQADERENSYLPAGNDGGLHRPIASWERQGPLSQLISFGMALVGTARTWVDEASLVLPGYRDRVVTVYQDGDAGEGGLNLTMPAPVVTRLSLRGRYAAEKLVDRFGPTGEGWQNHRWVRFRTATAGLSDWFSAFERGYAGSTPSYYDEVLRGDEPQPSYELPATKLTAARTRVGRLRKDIHTWGEPPADSFTDERPQPPPVLRLVPPGA